MQNLIPRGNRVYMAVTRTGSTGLGGFVHLATDRWISNPYSASWLHTISRGGPCWNGNAVLNILKMVQRKALHSSGTISSGSLKKHLMILPELVPTKLLTGKYSVFSSRPAFHYPGF